MKRLITTWLLLTIAGGITITSGMFYDMYREPKFCLTVISSLALLVLCCLKKNYFYYLHECLSSRLFAIGLSCLCIILSSHAILQFFYIIPSHSIFRITGTFDNPSGYALAQSLLLPFPMSLCTARHNSHLVKYFAAITAISVLFTIVISESRCGMLACFSSFAITTITKCKIHANIKRHKVLTIVCAFSIVLVCLMLYLMKQDSADGRILVWQVCLDMIKEKPLCGYGIHGFESYYMDCQAKYLELTSDPQYAMLAGNITHPYNEFMLVAVNYGVIGLVITVCLAAILIFCLLKSMSSMKWTWIAVIAALLVFSTFSYPFNFPQSMVFLLLSIIVAAPDKTVQGLSQKYYVRYPLAAVSILFLCLAVRHSYLNVRWAEISRRSLDGQTERMLPLYKEMLTHMKNNPMFLYNYAAELNYAGKYKESLEITKQCAMMYNDYDVQILLADNQENVGDMEAAVKTYRHASNMIPCRFIPLEGMMRVYQQTEDTVHADSVAKIIMTKRVKIPSAIVDDIKLQAMLWLKNTVK